MPLCTECKNQTCLKTKRPCPKVEKMLKTEEGFRDSKEILIGGDVMDKMFYKDKGGDISMAPTKRKYRE